MSHINTETNNIGATGHVDEQVVVIFVDANPNRKPPPGINLNQSQGVNLLHHRQSNTNISVIGLNQINKTDAHSITRRQVHHRGGIKLKADDTQLNKPS